MVQPDAALLLSEAAMMDSITLLAPGTGYAANPCHNGGISSPVFFSVKELSEFAKNWAFALRLTDFH